MRSHENRKPSAPIFPKKYIKIGSWTAVLYFIKSVIICVISLILQFMWMILSKAPYRPRGLTP